ncbi:MAG: DUF2244 domain-containing protein [Gammaproteobacteria bacterium]
MIQQIHDTTDCDARWVVQQTRSMTWGEAKLFVAAVTFVSIAIGVWFYAHGYPLVLPFSGLEALAVAIAFYVVLRDGENREVISLFPERVVIEKGRTRPNSRDEFDRAWARVELSHSPRRWYPSRLSITSHGRFVELGHFLTNGEREALASELINAIEKNR